MNKEQAFQTAIQGKPVHRKAWEPGVHLYFQKGVAYKKAPNQEATRYFLNDDKDTTTQKITKNPDRRATDWEVFIPTAEAVKKQTNTATTKFVNKKNTGKEQVLAIPEPSKPVKEKESKSTTKNK
jgi:hypothetical protein